MSAICLDNIIGREIFGFGAENPNSRRVNVSSWNQVPWVVGIKVPSGVLSTDLREQLKSAVMVITSRYFGE